MKKKFLILTLCFTLIFTSFNYKKSYADGGVISLPVLATVSSLAVGTGIVLKNSEDLYKLGRLFYDYVDKHNDLVWTTVQSVFASSVFLQPNKLVSVKSPFLDIVKGFLDDVFGSSKSDVIIKGFHIYPNFVSVSNHNYGPFKIQDRQLFVLGRDGVYHFVEKFSSDVVSISFAPGYSSSTYEQFYRHSNGSLTTSYSKPSNGHYIFDEGVVSFPYNGGYTWDNVESKKENESVSLPVPGNLGQLVGQTSDYFWDNTDNLVGSGDLSIPVVGSPSIGVDNSVSTFPVVGSPSVPNEGIWSTIKEFIISLVVPSDTFWTDTWGGLYGNFTSSFPMVDMDGFNDLVTGEKKFPNIDVDIMGVSGRVVNGDVINSIVDWLRPIIAGFMMLCLMLFNYRKIYKLIRNTEPFGGIAPGTSDFSTGISEYSKQEVVKATDMVAEYRAWRERGGK